MVPLYGLTVFLSAALLFAVQPMFTKLVLPLLGGSPSVWNTALVFFQGALLLGYAYAHLATRWLGVRRQAALHVAVLLVPLAVLPLGLPAGSAPAPEASPIPWLLLTLLLRVGPPFIVLSASGPLLQRWFSSTSHPKAPDPYFLYAASNVGSLLALFAYPTLLEPHLRLRAQSVLWAVLYGVLVLLMAGCALVVRREPAAAPSGPLSADQPGPSRRDVVRWVALAFVPSSLMVGLTTYVTTDVASAPLFWVVPLGIYLLTFIVAFSKKPAWVHTLVVTATPWFLGAAIVVACLTSGVPLWLRVALPFASFFVTSLMCHGELSEGRPGPAHLTAFFFWVSLGGALGGVFSALLAPALFRSVVEYRLTLIAASLLLPAVPGPFEHGLGKRIADFLVPVVAGGVALLGVMAAPRAAHPGMVVLLSFATPTLFCVWAARRPVRFGLGVSAILAVGFWKAAPAGIIFENRSFFGALRVMATPSAEDVGPLPPGWPDPFVLHELHHGTTMHGLQVTEAPASAVPLSYYSERGPVGQLFKDGPLPANANIAIVGLGAGTMAAYARPGQRWTFFDIDPMVVAIATNRDFFTYVPDARAPVGIVLGDARLSLGRSSERFDAIVLDAYSSDAIPVHLLTVEAMRLYLQRLAAHGVIALHLSNRHLDLSRVVVAIARELGLAYRNQVGMPTRAEIDIGISTSEWAIVARTDADFGKLAEAPRWRRAPEDMRPVLWTDDYSSIVAVFGASF